MVRQSNNMNKGYIMNYRKEQEILRKGTWALRYEILLFIFLSILIVAGITKIFNESEIMSNLGIILAGFIVYKLHMMKEENSYLEKIALLFYALNPDTKYEIYGILELQQKARLLPEVLDALLNLEDRATEHNLLLYLSQLQQKLDINPVIRELRANPALLQELKEIIKIRE